MSSTYLTLTIGPIYKTIIKARRTRELWAASYLFSWINKQIIECLVQKVEAADFIVPFIPDTKQLTPGSAGVGLVPDMLLLKVSNKASGKALMDDTLKKVKAKLAQELRIYGDDVATFVEDYFRFSYALFEEQANEKPIITMGKINDNLELTSRLVAQAENNPLLSLMDKASNSFLSEDAFGRRTSFDTLIQYATLELKRIDSYKYNILWSTLGKKTKDQNNNEQFTQYTGEELTSESPDVEASFVKALADKDSGFGDKFKVYHKYIAIVKADGDKIGDTIRNWKDSLRTFSEKLDTFGRSAAGAINAYGGRPIYIGGDDILFFAPVANEDSNIIALVEKLSAEFNALFKTEVDAFNQGKSESDKIAYPTLSAGISICYYKFPLYEALEKADSLMYEAKGESNQRNGVAWRILKHSGQEIGARLGRKEMAYSALLNMLNQTDIDAQNLKSVIQHFREAEPALWSIMAQSENPKHRVAQYFKNFFNERVHDKMRPYLDAVENIVVDILPKGESAKNLDNIKAALKIIYAILRTSNFLKGLDDSHE